jgi:NAD(P)-dependent dehydrogenase (short-subunit alcohol dehydrogenase family)
MEKSLEGRIVCVTGGTGALGSAVVERLTAAGAISYLASRRAESDVAAAAAATARTVGGVDLADQASVERFFAAASESGPIWASLHLAGSFAAGPITEAGADVFMDQMRANALSVFLCCREAIKVMRASGSGGRIVNVAARPALEPRQGAGMAAYTASKAAVAALTQALAEETAGDRIWINAVVPSIMDSPANRVAMPDADHGRWPKVEEVAATILFLASPQNQVTRGALAPVYGGV